MEYLIWTQKKRRRNKMTEHHWNSTICRQINDLELLLVPYFLECLKLLDTFHYSNGIDESDFKYLGKEYPFLSMRPIVRICDAKIWLKLLPNFGQFAKFIAIQCDYINERTTKIQIHWLIYKRKNLIQQQILILILIEN